MSADQQIAFYFGLAQRKFISFTWDGTQQPENANSKQCGTYSMATLDLELTENGPCTRSEWTIKDQALPQALGASLSPCAVVLDGHGGSAQLLVLAATSGTSTLQGTKALVSIFGIKL